MKVEFEEGDVVFHDGVRSVVQGGVYSINGMEGRHVVDAKGNITLVPEAELLTEDAHLLNLCLEVLDGYAEWEARIASDSEDSLLENLTNDNYERMISLQEGRNDIGKMVMERNYRKG